MTDGIAKIERLNNTNYSTWKFRVELLLIKEDLWDVIDGDETLDVEFYKKDGKARALIGLLVDDSQLLLIKNEKTARATWNALKNYHEKSTLTSKVFLIKKICRTRLSEGGNMEVHVNNMLEMIEKLRNQGENLSERWSVAFLLCSLPDSYDTLITALEARPEEDLTLDLVKSKLLHEYMKRNELSEGRSEDEGVSALKLSQRNTFNNREVICYHCSKPGHIRRFCPLLKRSNVPQTSLVHVCNKVEPGRYDRRNDWFIDSAATCHMSNNERCFTKFYSRAVSRVFLANGGELCSRGVGEVDILCRVNEDESKIVKLKNVLFVPDLDSCLLSVCKLAKEGFLFEFTENECCMSKDNIVMLKGYCNYQSLYKIDMGGSRVKKTIEKENFVSECIHVWHRRLGHRNYEDIREIFGRGLVKGGRLKDCNCREKICQICVKGKMTRNKFPRHAEHRASEPGDLIHSDVCGPMEKDTCSGNKYFLTFTDDFSRYTVVYVIKNKSQVFEKLKEYVEIVKNKFGRNIKMLRSDGGGEYMSNEVTSFLKSHGIQRQVTAPYTPQQNGVSERKNRTLVDMVRCMLIESCLDIKYWGEAVLAANYINNRLPTCDGVTPFERWNGYTASIRHLRPFGSVAYVHIPKHKRSKFAPKGERLILSGYSEEAKAYRFVDGRTSYLTISRDAVFVEDKVLERREECSDDMMKPKEEVEVILRTNEIKEVTRDNLVEPMREQVHQEEGAARGGENVELRVSSRIGKGVPPQRYGFKTVEEMKEPKTRKQAISSSDRKKWEEAMEDEMTSLNENETWELVDPPRDRKIIGCKWVFAKKKNVEGEVVRYKARLVAQGYSQKYGEDYNEVFAPVVKQTTVRTLLAVAAEKNLIVQQADVKTAFLNGDIDSEIFMKQPEGYEVKGKEEKVCKLKKSLYGIKQAARCWNIKLNEILLKYGFSRGKADTCLYVKQVQHGLLYLLVYVDDIILASPEQGNITEVIQYLKNYIELKLMGDLNFYLGVEVQRKENGFFLSQSHYIDKILDNFNLTSAKISKVPMDVGYLKLAGEEELLPNNELYRKAIGSLLYLAVNTRPDIMAAVSLLSRRVSCPRQADWVEVKRVLRYLKGTRLLKLRIGKASKEVVGYADADWGQNVNDRRSTSGYVFRLGDATISWSSRKQPCVALSSTEAEFISLCEACQEAQWIKYLLQDFKIEHTVPVIMEDNQSCLKLLEVDRSHPRTKHIDIKYHYTKELKESGDLMFEYVATEDMIADMMTKPLQIVKINKFSKWIGLSSSHDEQGC